MRNETAAFTVLPADPQLTTMDVDKPDGLPRYDFMTAAEVSTYLGERVKTDINLDYRDFYLLYTVRRDNARARQRLHLPGPKKTIEDHFFLFVTELEQEKQKKDHFADKEE